MLRVGVNHTKVNYNREEVFVHHLTDNITGKQIPICGTEVYDLTDDGDADWVIESIKEGRNPLDGSESSRMCKRCRTIYMAPGEGEEKSKRRLARWKRKEARRKLVEKYEKEVIENWLGHCPKCQSKVTATEPRGYSSAEAHCDVCNLEWAFLISAQKKQRSKEQKRERAAYLASMPTLTIAAKPEIVGQLLTAQLNSAGFTLSEYQPPQQVFGANTPYRAVYTKPITDINTGSNMRVWIYLTYGIPTPGQGNIAYYMAFEIADTPQGSVLTGRYGLTGQTVRGAVMRDMTSADNFRRELDDTLENLKHSAEKVSTVLKPPTYAEMDAQFWEIIQNSSSLLDCETYLEKYPSGRFAEVIRKREESIVKRPETATAKKHGELAAELARESKWDESENEWREAIALESNSLLLMANLVDLLGKRNKWTEAERLLKQAIELDPKNARWYFSMPIGTLAQPWRLNSIQRTHGGTGI